MWCLLLLDDYITTIAHNYYYICVRTGWLRHRALAALLTLQLAAGVVGAAHFMIQPNTRAGLVLYRLWLLIHLGA